MRIVCFHLNQVGDLAFSLPALKCIRESSPDAFLASVVRPGVKEVLQSTALAEEVLTRNSVLNVSKYRLARSLAGGRFDLAIVFSQSAECALLAYLSRAPRRIGFINTSLGRLLTETVDFHHPPSTDNNLRLVEAAGCTITKRDYVGLLRPTPAQTERAGKVLAEHGIGSEDAIAVLAPGTSGRRSLKEWTDEGFAVVARHLASRGLRALILGTVPVPGIAAEDSEIIDLSGRTDLGEAVAVLDRARLLVAVDSGILHLAAALGRQVVGLYGPSNPRITGPQGEGHMVLTSGADCSPCVRTTCDRNRKCMLDLVPEQVIDAVDQILDGKRGGH